MLKPKHRHHPYAENTAMKFKATGFTSPFTAATFYVQARNWFQLNYCYSITWLNPLMIINNCKRRNMEHVIYRRVQRIQI